MTLDELRERSRRVWGVGDYSPTSRQLEPASKSLVETLQVGAGDRVLDVAAGHGNCAIAAAKRGATVTAVDFSEAMTLEGQRRTSEAGLSILWEVADAAALPFDDRAFDVVTSVFGVIFSFDPLDAAAEAVRVVRPGGRIGWTAWTRDSLTAATQEVRRSYASPWPAGVPDAFDWGDPSVVRARFEPLGCDVAITERVLTFRYASWDDWRQASEAHGVAIVARQTMSPQDYATMFDELRGVTAAHARETPMRVEFDNAYLELIITKP